MTTLAEAAAAAVNERGVRQEFLFEGVRHINHPGCARGTCLCVVFQRPRSELEAIIERSMNISAKRELAELRRIQLAARKLVASWREGGDRTLSDFAELESAVLRSTPHPGAGGTRDM